MTGGELSMTERAWGDPFMRIWSAFDAGGMLAACAWCGRVRIDGTWLLPPPAALAAVDPRHAFSHSICDSCSDRLRYAPIAESAA